MSCEKGHAVGIRLLGVDSEKLLVLQERFSDIHEAFKELDRVSDHLIAVINQTVSHDLMDSMLEDCDTYMKETEYALDRIRAELASHMSGNLSKRPEMHVKPRCCSSELDSHVLTMSSARAVVARPPPEILDPSDFGANAKAMGKWCICI